MYHLILSKFHLLSPSFVFDSFGLKLSLIVILTNFIFLIRQIRQNYQHVKICSSTVVLLSIIINVKLLRQISRY